MSDEDTAKLGTDMAALLNETNCDLATCFVTALHFAVAASAGVFTTKQEARENLVTIIDSYLAELPENFSDLEKQVN